VTLSLPADIEPYTDDYRTPAVYALDVAMPDDLLAEWDRRFDARAAWFDELQAANAVVYVGATSDLINRLEEHRDRTVRRAVLPSLATDLELRNVWPQTSADQAYIAESQTAIRLQNHLPATTFVRSA
jgi:predicted GIY-YIG superfamily endonuclease